MKTFLFFVCSFCLMTTTMRAGQPLSYFNGTWENINPNTNSIVKVDISVSGTTVSVRPWGKCSPTPCDWTSQIGVAYTNTSAGNISANTEGITAVYSPGFSVSTVVITPTPEKISVSVYTKFTDGSGRTNFTITESFVRGNAGGGGGGASFAAPIMVSPKCGSTFDFYPRTTPVKWQPVAGAATYTVEVDCFHCCKSGVWCSDVGKPWKVVPNLTETYYKFDYVGAQEGRWRVWAVKADGTQSPKSEWCTFRYTK
jgi:hypothetical protein